MDDNGLRTETGALIGGLVVLDYVQGIDDFNAGIPPPDMTTPSYDLGRQRAAEKRERDAEVRAWLDREQAERMRKLKEMLPPDAYAEIEQKITAIRR
jgi:hypothetical protein